MTGQCRGVQRLLQERENRKISCMHCLNYQLHLVVVYAMSVEQAINDFLHACGSLCNFLNMLGDYETDSVPDCVLKNMSHPFPCRSPLKPHMRSSDARMQIFSKNWPMKDHATPHEMAYVGFYYLSDSGRVVCFCYAGGLKNWEVNENLTF